MIRNEEICLPDLDIIDDDSSVHVGALSQQTMPVIVESRTRISDPPSVRPWLAHYPLGVPPAVEVPAGSIGDIFDQTAARCSLRPAMHFYRRTISYTELAGSVQSFAASLSAMGVGKGDRVALHLPNCPQYAIAFFATLKLGATVVQISPLLAPPEIDWCLMRTGAKVLVSLNLLLEAVSRTRSHKHLTATVVATVGSYFRRLERWMENLWHLRARFSLFRKLEGNWVWFDTMSHHKRTELPEVEIDPANDVAVLQPTGGTTGKQKFAMLTYRNLLANVAQLTAWAGMSEKDVVLGAPPFTHAYGLTVGLLCAVLNGGATAILPRWRPDAALDAIVEHKVTVAPLAPPMASTLAREQNRRKLETPTLRASICGGAALTPEVEKAFVEAFASPIYQGFGLSEASPVTHCNPVGENVTGSIGLPICGTDARIVALDDGHELGIEELGELQVRGPQVMKGYQGGSDEPGVQDGWLPTGDLARCDARGWFHLMGRRKEMILTNGLNVYPIEVEEVLRAHPCVEDAAVVARGNTLRGEVVEALIVLADGCRFDQADLTAWCAERLAGYKCPRTYVVVPKLSRDSSGRLKRSMKSEGSMKSEV